MKPLVWTLSRCLHGCLNRDLFACPQTPIHTLTGFPDMPGYLFTHLMNFWTTTWASRYPSRYLMNTKAPIHMTYTYCECYLLFVSIHTAIGGLIIHLHTPSECLDSSYVSDSHLDTHEIYQHLSACTGTFVESCWTTIHAKAPV